MTGRRPRAPRCWISSSPISTAMWRRAAAPTTSLRHILGLYHGQPRARAFRRLLSEQGPRTTTGGDLVRAALGLVEGAPAREAAE